MPIAYSLRFKILDLGRRLILARDWIAVSVGRLTGERRPDLFEAGVEARIPAGLRAFNGRFVAQEGELIASVLIFHGIGDSTRSWRGVQARLAMAGVSSLIFEYPGYGRNTAEPTQRNMEGDARFAYAWLVTQIPEMTPIFLFGFSLGSGLSSAVASSLRPVPSGLILSEAFTTLREAAKRAAWPVSPLGYLLPDVWKTRETVADLKMPLYVIHSSGDRLFPTSMAEAIYAAAKEGGAEVAMEVFAGYPHDTVYRQVPEPYWEAILGFITRISKG